MSPTNLPETLDDFHGSLRERRQRIVILVAGTILGLATWGFAILARGFTHTIDTAFVVLVLGGCLSFAAVELARRHDNRRAGLLLTITFVGVMAAVPWTRVGSGLFDGATLFAVMAPIVAMLTYSRRAALIATIVHVINIVALFILRPVPATSLRELAVFHVASGVFLVVSIFVLLWVFEDTRRDAEKRVTRMLIQERENLVRVEEGNQRLKNAHDVAKAESQLKAEVTQNLVDVTRQQSSAIAGTRVAAEDMSAIFKSTSAQVLEVRESTQRSGESVVSLAELSAKNIKDIDILLEVTESASNSIMNIVDSQQGMSNRIDELVIDANQSSAAMDGMKLSIADIEESARSAEVLARRVIETANLGDREMVRVLEGMEAIRDNSQTASAAIYELGELIESIDQILLVITDVADETQLLSLNASIIATQAGRHGRAFSVVAGEIKKLAQRTMQSAGAIQNLVTTVQNKSRAAINNIGINEQAVSEGYSRSVQTSKSLEAIVQSAHEATERVRTIVESTKRQLGESERVVQAAARVEDNTQKIRAQMSAQARQSDELHSVSIAIRQAAKAAEQKAQAQGQSTKELKEDFSRILRAVEQIVERHDDHVSTVERILDALRTIENSQNDQSVSIKKLREGL